MTIKPQNGSISLTTEYSYGRPATKKRVAKQLGELAKVHGFEFRCLFLLVIVMKEPTDKDEITVDGISIPEILDEYWRDLQALNRSNKTISWYRDILKRYFSFLMENEQLKPLADFGKRELSDYLLHLQNTTRWANKPQTKSDYGKLSAYSIQGHARAVKAFWGWLFSEGYIAENPLEKFKLPKVPQNLISVISTVTSSECSGKGKRKGWFRYLCQLAGKDGTYGVIDFKMGNPSETSAKRSKHRMLMQGR